MILIDSNVPMYIVGAAHPHKEDAARILQDCVRRHERLVTDAEVFQEILHRYAAINRREQIQTAFNALLAVVDEVLTVDLQIVERAKDTILAITGVSARDALHLAVMQQHGIKRILSFDTGFDAFPGIQRLG